MLCVVHVHETQSLKLRLDRFVVWSFRIDSTRADSYFTGANCFQPGKSLNRSTHDSSSCGFFLRESSRYRHRYGRYRHSSRYSYRYRVLGIWYLVLGTRHKLHMFAAIMLFLRRWGELLPGEPKWTAQTRNKYIIYYNMLIWYNVKLLYSN